MERLCDWSKPPQAPYDLTALLLYAAVPVHATDHQDAERRLEQAYTRIRKAAPAYRSDIGTLA